MKRSIEWLAPRRRFDWFGRLRRLAERRWPLALNVATALAILCWLGLDRPAVSGDTITRADAMPTTVWDEVPSAVRELWRERYEAFWGADAYVPGSNQRIVGHRVLRDPDLEIVETRITVRTQRSDALAGHPNRVGVDNTQVAVGDDASKALTELETSVADRKAVAALGGKSEPAPAKQKSVPKPDKKPEASGRADKNKSKASTPKRKVRRLWFTVTAYCPCKKCCGRWAKYHKTASGLPVTYNGGHLVAADTDVLPFHTLVRIPGYAGGKAVPVVDRGGAIKGRMIDVFFPTHWSAQRWGKKRLLVEVLD